MRIFLTGATGFIGSHLVPELLAAGHEVLGLTRSDAGAQALAAAGAEVHRGDLEDPETLSAGAALADAVIHTAFDHNFTDFAANCAKDERAIRALAAPLAGTGRPLLITSGIGIGIAEPGTPAMEDVFDTHHPNPRTLTEIAGAAVLAEGVNLSVVRLPQVHDTVKQGLITYYVAMARAKGAAAYVGDGGNRWSAAHIGDVARLYRRAVEAGEAGARYHAVAEEGVSFRAIAETVAAGLGVPAVSVPPGQAAEHFGWLALFATQDLSASSAWTRARLGWQPTGPGLIADLERMDYTKLR
ncbi:SDR family oxidoreductase [Sphingomonas sanxanigenens]|uniref:NAD(P)-binding domain-containing protein n=1 Tax=Sphingomonas sanxanigenens DSM 19645 = NX02 TaxID=1123269 RepID=W0A9X8_9SPHN|nr:SDR family oxidoreductase [Sphingomonas sanxanigenens]AHE54739.1 hypothetical protein NX02_15280 [Sphingomonas sanxanigenens DSM 19645 = NX02]